MGAEMSIRALLFVGMVLAGASAQSAPAEAASAIQSTNCPNALCASFSSTTTIPTIKAYQFSMPGAGTALVTFNGTLYCAASGSAGDRVIDLVSGISSSETAAISLSNTGSLRNAHVLKDEVDHTFDPSTSFNLQSTKLLTYSSGGSKTVYFRIVRSRQDAGVSCFVYGGSFTIVRHP
jgi:hypothetical protein